MIKKLEKLRSSLSITRNYAIACGLPHMATAMTRSISTVWELVDEYERINQKLSNLEYTIDKIEGRVVRLHNSGDF